MLLLDNREGSYRLAHHEPVRSLLATCPACAGKGVGSGYDCNPCRGTGRQLSRITTSAGVQGPDVLIVGDGPSGPLLVAVEVKSLSDLISSADTGRLQAQGEGQLDVMLRDYAQSWLLWYGNVRRGDSGQLEEPGGRGDNGRCLWRPYTKNGTRDGRPLPYSYLAALLLAVARMGVHVQHTTTERDAALWIGDLYDSWTKPWSEHRFTNTFSSAPRFPKVVTDPATGLPVPEKVLARARRIFDRYTGLGMERSLAVALHFPSVQAVANATIAELREVPGIGPVIAKAVHDEFRS